MPRLRYNVIVAKLDGTFDVPLRKERQISSGHYACLERETISHWTAKVIYIAMARNLLLRKIFLSMLKRVKRTVMDLIRECYIIN